MNFDLSDEQRLLRDTARDWFSARCAPADMRGMLGGAAVPHDLARDLAAQGFLGILVDEAHGGGGMGVLDLAVVAEEAGRVLAAAPLVGCAAHAVALLRECGGDASERLLRAIAAGEEVAAVVDGPGLRLGAHGGSARVDGVSAPAPGAASASVLLVVAGSGPGTVVATVRAGAGTRLEERRPLDPTRALGVVAFDGAPADVLAQGDAASRAVARARHVAATVLAAEGLGAATRCLELAVEYAQQRVAFGRPIGSFQAVKHACVDMFVLVEQLRSLTWYAAWAADHDRDRLPLAASAAKAFAADALERCASTLVQVHGGIGFTWEHDAHLFWRRAHVDRLLYGDAAEHRDAVASLALAGAPVSPGAS